MSREEVLKVLKKLVSLLDRSQRAAVRRFALLCLFSPAADMVGVSMMIPVLQQAFQRGMSSRLAGRVFLLALVLMLVGVFELVRGRFSTTLVVDLSHNWSVRIYEMYSMEELEDHNRRTPMQAAEGVRTDTAVCAGMIPAYLSLAVDGMTTAAYSLALIYVARGVGAVSCLLMAALMAVLYV